jgi:ABC-type uncharacterized transport system involved in gliding motility auxiliary subunit
MRGTLPFVGFAGIVMFLFGVISYAIGQRVDRWTAIHLVGGVVLLALGIYRNLAGLRRTVTARGTRERAQALVSAAVFGGILVAANVLAARHPWRYDATENRIHTLSDQTVSVVRGLAEPVEIVAFFQAGDPGREAVAELLDRYAALSGKLTWRFVDPVRDPGLADQLGVRERGVVVARLGKTTAQAGGGQGAGITEGAITNLLIKVTRPGPKAVYFLTGHGEPGIADRQSPAGLHELSEALEGENFDTRDLFLATAAKVPDDAALVIVAGPRKPLLPHEVEQLRVYLESGGRALLLLEPGIDAGLSPLLVDYRVALGDDMIVDEQQSPLFGARLGIDPVVEDFPSHPITRTFKERIVLLGARSVDARQEGGIEGADAQVVARTRETSWAEKEYASMLASQTVTKDPADRGGPIPVAVASTAAKARLVVIGDSELAGNENLSAFFDREFLLNAVQWLVGDEQLIAERPKGFRPSRLDMTQEDFSTLFRLGVLLLPEALLVLGLAVWWRRRSL